MRRLPSLALGAVLSIAAAASSAAQDPGHRFPASLAPTYITDIQRELAARGYYSGPISGQINPATTVAIGLFQGDVGLPVTGLADSEVDKMLHVGSRVHATASPVGPPPEPLAPQKQPAVIAVAPAEPSSKPMDDPKDVEIRTIRGVQELLSSRGFYTGPVDGIPGAATVTAFKAFSEGTMAVLESAPAHGPWPTGFLVHKPKPGEIVAAPPAAKAVDTGEASAPSAPAKANTAPPPEEVTAPPPAPPPPSASPNNGV